MRILLIARLFGSRRAIGSAVRRSAMVTALKGIDPPKIANASNLSCFMPFERIEPCLMMFRLALFNTSS